MDRVNKAGGFGYPILTMNDFALPFRKAIGNIKKVNYLPAKAGSLLIA